MPLKCGLKSVKKKYCIRGSIKVDVYKHLVSRLTALNLLAQVLPTIEFLLNNACLNKYERVNHIIELFYKVNIWFSFPFLLYTFSLFVK